MNPILSNLQESASLATAALAKRLRETGRDIVSLALGDTHFSPSPAICQAFQQALRDGKTHYGPAAGIPELREKIAADLPGGDWQADHVLVVPGLKQGLYYLLQAIKPRRVAALEPAWLGYQATAHLVQAEYCGIDATRSDWLSRLNDTAFDALVFCSPNNPNGWIANSQQMRELVDICRRKDAWLIADEIYSRFDYSGNWCSLAGGQPLEKLVVCNGFSKSHAMTGFRLGWLACRHDPLVRACLALQQHIATCPGTPAQHAMAATFDDRSATTMIRETYRENRDLIARDVPWLRQYLPQGGFYYFFPVTPFGETDGAVFAERLLQEEGLALVPGGAYGEAFRGWVRLSFSVDRQLLGEGLHRLKRFTGVAR